MNPSENSSSPEKTDSVQQQIDSLRKMFVVVMVILVVLTLALNLYFARQVANVRQGLEPQAAIVEQYKKTELPNIQNFVSKLQEYSKTHPDINPILAKYNLLPSTNTIFSPAPAKAK